MMYFIENKRIPFSRYSVNMDEKLFTLIPRLSVNAIIYWMARNLDVKQIILLKKRGTCCVNMNYTIYGNMLFCIKLDNISLGLWTIIIIV